MAILASCFRDANEVDQHTTLCSVKSMIGHSEVAAGVMAISHTVASLTKRRAFPLTHLRNVNPFVADSLHSERTLKVHTLREFSNLQTKAMSSGISSFAFQGTNAHAILCTQDQERMGNVLAPTFEQERCTVLPMWGFLTSKYCPPVGRMDICIQSILDGCNISKIVRSHKGLRLTHSNSQGLTEDSQRIHKGLTMDSFWLTRTHEELTKDSL